MNLSVFDLFKVGIGPSSSHTVGPMRAAKLFVLGLQSPETVTRVKVDLYGSLALTGKGHATDCALILGLLGEDPESINPSDIPSLIDSVRQNSTIKLLGKFALKFSESCDLEFHFSEVLPEHPNGMVFSAYNELGEQLAKEIYFSVGGGFVTRSGEAPPGSVANSTAADSTPAPYLFRTGAELLELVNQSKLQIWEIVWANELAKLPAQQIADKLDNLWSVMEDSITRGCAAEGLLPGGLNVRRRAPSLYKRLTTVGEMPGDPMMHMDWVSLFALAVNEENASGGRIVTAPTNGAAGIIPAVLSYYKRFIPGASKEGIHKFLLTAAAIGMLYKWNASLSAAEMGCQGEVGVACSMAAAGLAAVMGGSAEQIENAAEIGMEHNLGLTCDPVKGLVQIPCIERNTMGAVKAINAARLAVLYGDGKHQVSLDSVIETMRQTGLDMRSKYKETSQGGLAVNVVDC